MLQPRDRYLPHASWEYIFYARRGVTRRSRPYTTLALCKTILSPGQAPPATYPKLSMIGQTAKKLEQILYLFFFGSPRYRLGTCSRDLLLIRNNLLPAPATFYRLETCSRDLLLVRNNLLSAPTTFYRLGTCSRDLLLVRNNL